MSVWRRLAPGELEEREEGKGGGGDDQVAVTNQHHKDTGSMLVSSQYDT